MRPASRYPVDRYLVESSKRMDIIEIMDDDLWKPEPALRPEDEFLLRKLHDMLQSTADDLKVLSGELSKYHESGVQVKTLPTPLDDDFNKRVHVEEVVNAKFHGNQIVNPLRTESQSGDTAVKDLIANELRKMQFRCDSRKEAKVSKSLGVSRTKIVNIPERANYMLDDKPLDFRIREVPGKERTVQYNEIVHEELNEKEEDSQKLFKIQEMPSINIRSQFKIQHVARLDITPDSKDVVENVVNNNICVISVNHDHPVSRKESHKIEVDFENTPVRKVSKMSDIESSDSAPNVASRPKNEQKIDQKELNKQKRPVAKLDSYKAQTNLNDWKRKLSSVYGQSSREGRSKLKANNQNKMKQVPLPKLKLNNDSEYIPYAKLTLGGANVTDIEEEISGISNKNDLPLSPILEKLLSRQNSFSREIPQKHENKDNLKVLTTSDENLLQEVLDIEEKISITLSSNLKNFIDNSLKHNTEGNNSPDDNTYADDFEADNSNGISDKSESLKEKPENGSDHQTSNENVQNKTYVKVLNLSLKNKIETFDYIHTVDTKENATQSNANKHCLEAQTSPRSDSPSLDPKHKVENLFKLEKDFIKKLILDEYSDLIIDLNKPSTSNDSKAHIDSKNMSSAQKNTQTSPARVKSVMTSPARTKTRTTSPLTLTIDKQTSPLELLPTASDKSVNLEEFDITINLSSPRFQLQLPKSTTHSNQRGSRLVSSSTSVEDYTSSDISFGEMRRQRRRSRRQRVPSLSERSSTTKCSEDSFVVPIRSEGEISACQNKSTKCSKSEGEISLGQLR